MSQEEASKVHAAQCLEQLGLSVMPIPPAPPVKRADLRAFADNGEEYVVEAKHRDPRGDWKAFYSAALTNPGSKITRTFEPWGGLEKTIGRAARQLAATPSGAHAFRLIWIAALHEDAEFVLGSFERALLGVEPLTVMENVSDPTAITMKDCYHYRRNCFRHYTQVDAAVLFSERRGKLLVNHFSPNKARFRNSVLYRAVTDLDSVIDPEEDVARGTHLMLDYDFSGPYDGSGQWQHLKDKHGLLTSVGLDSQFDTMLRIRRETMERASKADKEVL